MTYAEQIEERRQRLAAQIERRRELTEKRLADADRAWGRVEQILGDMPLGQPVLAGHHSEGSHRAILHRRDLAMDRWHENDEKARYHEHRAESAERQLGELDDPGFARRRLDEAEAEVRHIKDLRDRRLVQWPQEAAHWQKLLAEAQEKVAYWKGQLDQAQAKGVKIWGPADFKPGDMALTRRGPRLVVRVNTKSLSIQSSLGSWTDKLGYDKITGRCSAAEYQGKKWPTGDYTIGGVCADGKSVIIAECHHEEL